MHKKRYWIGLALALVMFLSSGAPAGQVYATSLEEQRDQALDKIDDIKADIKTVKSKIQNLKNSKSDLQSYINELDEQATQLAQQQGIEGIPTLVLYRDGKALGSVTAPASKAAIDEFIRQKLQG